MTTSMIVWTVNTTNPAKLRAEIVLDVTQKLQGLQHFLAHVEFCKQILVQSGAEEIFIHESTMWGTPALVGLKPSLREL